jgi:hypothetical protein
MYIYSCTYIYSHDILIFIYIYNIIHIVIFITDNLYISIIVYIDVMVLPIIFRQAAETTQIWTSAFHRPW